MGGCGPGDRCVGRGLVEVAPEHAAAPRGLGPRDQAEHRRRVVDELDLEFTVADLSVIEKRLEKLRTSGRHGSASEREQNALEEELLARAQAIQERTHEVRGVALDALATELLGDGAVGAGGVRPFQTPFKSRRSPVPGIMNRFSYKERSMTPLRRSIAVVIAACAALLVARWRMLANKLPTILPDLTLAEALETTKIHSVMGLLNGSPIIATRPFRYPHHTISDAGLVGGGTVPKPGEVSLAHNGVLFLDELPEFKRNVLEVMRQPLEDGSITVSRAIGSINYPAGFMLVAAMNPCPCGWAGDPSGRCRCSQENVRRYRGKVSGPLMDRIDLHVEVPRLPPQELRPDAPDGEPTASVRERVVRARALQTGRNVNGKVNAQLGQADTMLHCR